MGVPLKFCLAQRIFYTATVVTYYWGLLSRIIVLIILMEHIPKKDAF
jgi:hypothetical protein